MEPKWPKLHSKAISRYNKPQESFAELFASETIREVPETDEQNDSAEISSDEETEGVPKKELHPLLNTSNFIKPSLKLNVSKMSSPTTIADKHIEFSSTNDSSDHPSSVQYSINTSTPKAKNKAQNMPVRESEDLVELGDEISANVPNSTNETKPNIFPKEGQEDVPDSNQKVNKRFHENMISHPDLKLILIQGKKLADAFAVTKKGYCSPRAITDFREGYLEKQSTSLLETWKTKYCRVGNSIFMFFKSLQNGLLSGHIDFRRIPTKITYDPMNLTFTLAIYWNGKAAKQFIFRSKNKDDLLKWVHAISYHIEKCKMVDYAKVFPTVNYFWKFRILPEKEFVQRVETGDLLLFTGDRIACKLQRMFTRSRFGILLLKILKNYRSYCYVIKVQNWKNNIY